MFYPDNKKAKPGDIIEFKMENSVVKGEVLPSNCKKSIIVDIASMNDIRSFSHSYPNTVVAHHNYRVIESK